MVEERVYDFSRVRFPYTPAVKLDSVGNRVPITVPPFARPPCGSKATTTRSS